MADQTANTVVFKKNGTTYQVVSSTDDEAIKKILDIEDEISTLESNISTVTKALTTAQSKAVNKIVFCSEVPSDSIGSVNTLYLTRTMGGGITEPVAAVIHCYNASKFYGEDDPQFTGYVEGLIDGDTEEDFGDITYERPGAGIDEVPGSYPDAITATVANLNPKYTYTVINGNFTIHPSSSVIP